MKILLTGANGYIGQRLLPLLVEAGHEVVALVRSARRLTVPQHCRDHLHVVEGDLLKYEKIGDIPTDIDIAYYLVHSMTQTDSHFGNLEVTTAKNFLRLIEKTTARQVIYLSGLISDEKLSPHLKSRKRVEDVLRSGPTPVTTLRAGIILGSGSASFEIMRDLVEKLPIMVTPKWVKNTVQPIGIYDVLEYLVSVIDHPECLNQTFIGMLGELMADQQMVQFRYNPNNRKKVCKVGLWRYSRHPNYFFESVIWISYAVIAMNHPQGFIGWISPAVIVISILKITGIPPTEERLLASKGDAYREYQRTTSAFIPMPPRRNR